MPVDVRGSYSLRGRRWYKKTHISFGHLLGPTSISAIFIYLFIYQLFWTQACPEGMCTNGTHRSHARCHPSPIPQSEKVGYNTRVYIPYSFRIVMWVLLRPTQCKCCETGPTVFSSLSEKTRKSNHLLAGKGSTFFSVI